LIAEARTLATRIVAIVDVLERDLDREVPDEQP
jgi:hypothetical protein